MTQPNSDTPKSPEEAERGRCGACNAPRQGDACHKCGSPTFVPHPDWTEPALPPIGIIRTIARRWGYAIGEHGTQERDVDLIAAPWIENAAPPDILVHYICEGIGATIADRSAKPLGRNAYNLQMDGWYKLIDLSVCPRQLSAPSEEQTGWVLDGSGPDDMAWDLATNTVSSTLPEPPTEQKEQVP